MIAALAALGSPLAAILLNNLTPIPVTRSAVVSTPPDLTSAQPESRGRRIPIGFLDEITALLQLNRCDYSRSRFNDELKDSTAYIGTTSFSCVAWSDPKSPGNIIFSGSVNIRQAKIPVVAYFNKLSIRSGGPTSLIVDVVGGPGGNIAPGLNDNLQLALVQRGSVVIKLGYTGTRHGTIFPRPDFDTAVEEVAEYTKTLRQHNRSRKIVLLGESLGSHIAARVAASGIVPSLDGMALVLPLVFSPERAFVNFRKINERQNLSITALLVRLINSSHDSWDAGRKVSITSRDLFAGFFPAESRSRNLASYLSKAKNVKTLIAYGALDGRTGIDELRSNDFGSSNIYMLKLLGAGHTMEAKTALDVSDEIYYLFL